MKRLIPAGLGVLLSVICLAVKVKAQHFLSVQSGDKQPFAIQVNGNNFTSSKTGSLRIANLSSGNYSLVITPGGKKYPPQNFTCIIEKSDLSYTLVNDGKNGWLLKNTKSPEVIVSSTPVIQPVEVAKNEPKGGPSASSPFAVMLAQVINDPDLLKPTPWVLSTKVGLDESQDMSAAMNEAEQQDTSTYVAATKGVIKASEEPVKGGTEFVFVDFNAEQGDTIHILIPSTGDDDSAAVAQTQQQQAAPNGKPAEKADSTVPQPPPVVNSTTKTDSTAAIVKKEETAIPFDTSSNRQFTNPFFKKDDSSPVAATTAANVAANPADDHSAASQKDTTADVIEKKSAAVQPAANAAKPTVKTDCKKMLSDNDEEKLKHKIYLETDQDKILALTRKALDGKCISTAQVKELASFFLSDDARYNFFFTVYPYVYDFGNFSSLEPYMIDHKYKNMFEAMIK
ncbi:MAG TPA: DUF4476 domain-containing protein [Chitinophagaceae bacterium]|nr:DUF4476 domain-containing protein [Chitinophagaceae bacterium]